VSDSGLQCNKHNSYWYGVQYQDRQTALGFSLNIFYLSIKLARGMILVSRVDMALSVSHPVSTLDQYHPRSFSSRDDIKKWSFRQKKLSSCQYSANNFKNLWDQLVEFFNNIFHDFLTLDKYHPKSFSSRDDIGVSGWYGSFRITSRINPRPISSQEF
jgi:hypothetical protein